MDNVNVSCCTPRFHTTPFLEENSILGATYGVNTANARCRTTHRLPPLRQHAPGRLLRRSLPKAVALYAVLVACLALVIALALVLGSGLGMAANAVPVLHAAAATKNDTAPM